MIDLPDDIIENIIANLFTFYLHDALVFTSLSHQLLTSRRKTDFTVVSIEFGAIRHEFSLNKNRKRSSVLIRNNITTRQNITMSMTNNKQISLPTIFLMIYYLNTDEDVINNTHGCIELNNRVRHAFAELLFGFDHSYGVMSCANIKTLDLTSGEMCSKQPTLAQRVFVRARELRLLRQHILGRWTGACTMTVKMTQRMNDQRTMEVIATLQAVYTRANERCHRDNDDATDSVTLSNCKLESLRIIPVSTTTTTTPPPSQSP